MCLDSDRVPDVRTLILRGVKRRCPHCGKGPLFIKLLQLREHCSACGLKLEFKAGDTWGFWVFFDRIIIGVPVLLLLIGVPLRGAAFNYWAGFLLLVILLTAQHRYGICVALDYLSRRKTADPKDVFPNIPA